MDTNNANQVSQTENESKIELEVPQTELGIKPKNLENDDAQETAKEDSEKNAVLTTECTENECNKELQYVISTPPPDSANSVQVEIKNLNKKDDITTPPADSVQEEISNLNKDKIQGSVESNCNTVVQSDVNMDYSTSQNMNITDELSDTTIQNIEMVPIEEVNDFQNSDNPKPDSDRQNIAIDDTPNDQSVSTIDKNVNEESNSNEKPSDTPNTVSTSMDIDSKNEKNDASEISATELVASPIKNITSEIDPIKIAEKPTKASEVLINKNIKNTSLGFLQSQYNDSSDSDNDTPDYREKPVEINTDTSDDSDIEILTDKQKEHFINLENMLDDDEDDDDDDEYGTSSGNKKTKRGPPRVKGELLLEDLPPIEDLHITVPEAECVELGKIHSIIDQLLLVDSLPGTVPLNLDTVLFLEKGKKVLGEIFDVLGQVNSPLYCIRFNSNNQIKEKGIEIGQIVYVAPRTEHTQFVILPNLINIRGSDASWENDIEPNDKHVEFSDDEEERNYRKSLRNKDHKEFPNKDAGATKRTRKFSGGSTSSSAMSEQPSEPRQQQRYPQHNRIGEPGNYGQRRFRPRFDHDQNSNGSWHSNYNTNNNYNMNNQNLPRNQSQNQFNSRNFNGRQRYQNNYQHNNYQPRNNFQQNSSNNYQQNNNSNNYQQNNQSNNYQQQIPNNYQQQVPNNYQQQVSNNYQQQIPNNYQQQIPNNYEQSINNYSNPSNYHQQNQNNLEQNPNNFQQNNLVPNPYAIRPSLMENPVFSPPPPPPPTRNN